jgi:hypothetical protein
MVPFERCNLTTWLPAPMERTCDCQKVFHSLFVLSFAAIIKILFCRDLRSNHELVSPTHFHDFLCPSHKKTHGADFALLRMRHRSPELWGDDAHKFNPWREWKENELWGENGEQIPFMAFNPSSVSLSLLPILPASPVSSSAISFVIRWFFFVSGPIFAFHVPTA